jgi:hypothetical protein
VKWTKVNEQFWVVQAGVLHAGAFKDDRTWNWWVGTIDAMRDKSDEHALEQGVHTRRQEAFRDAETAMDKLVRDTANALGLNVE